MKNSETTPTGLPHLPPEIWGNVYKQLPSLQGRATMARTCKEWNTQFASEDLFEAKTRAASAKDAVTARNKNRVAPAACNRQARRLVAKSDAFVIPPMQKPWNWAQTTGRFAGLPCEAGIRMGVGAIAAAPGACLGFAVTEVEGILLIAGVIPSLKGAWWRTRPSIIRSATSTENARTSATQRQQPNWAQPSRSATYQRPRRPLPA